MSDSDISGNATGGAGAPAWFNRQELKILLVFLGGFLLFYFAPFDAGVWKEAVISAFSLLHEYARQHVLTCLVPAFFIAGAIAMFVRKDAVLKYLGSKAKPLVAYSLASVSGAILAVCSCTILPLFAGIRKRGAGLGPAVTFLFSGPAINIAAMFLTISVLGPAIGGARIVMAVILSVVVGVLMQVIFREKTEEGGLLVAEEEHVEVGKGVTAALFAALVGVLVVNGLQIDPGLKWGLMGVGALAAVLIAAFGLPRKARNDWLGETWGFTKMLVPLLAAGVFVAGFIMPFLPEDLITGIVGSNTVLANFVAAVFGAFMYFSTLTEIPILQALMAKGMSNGPALALLLAGPSLSLPNMLVIRRVLGTKKTVVYVLLVVVLSTMVGMAFGWLIG
ncbi:MAG: permease [Coriobacteriia bacterium]